MIARFDRRQSDIWRVIGHVKETHCQTVLGAPEEVADVSEVAKAGHKPNDGVYKLTTMGSKKLTMMGPINLR